MGAPDFVPLKTNRRRRTYSSPPRRPGSWLADRPGDLNSRQPLGAQLGSPGPDQGYALTIAETFRDQLHLAPNEHAIDVIAGCVSVALKRASLFGRAPVVHDLRIAFTVWGYLDASAPTELVEVRRPMFDECHHPHFYLRLRAIADAVPSDLLAQSTEAALAAGAGWRPT